MKRMVMVTFVVLLFMARSVYACQCIGRPAAAEALRSAEAVFEGSVILRRMVLAQQHGWLFPVPEYEFRVSRVWKGAPAPTIRLLGGYGNCAYFFRKNAPYLVFVGRHWARPDRLSSSICNRTKLASEATADLAALGTPAAVFEGARPRGAEVERLRAYAVAGIAVFGNLLRHGDENFMWAELGVPAAVLAVLALVALIAVIFAYRRWRRGLALIGMAILLAIASLLAAGQHVYRDSWFAQYLE